MEKFVFQSKNGYCPECIAFGRKWYIQDRELYPGMYEYCLRSFALDDTEKKYFQSTSEVVAWFQGIETNVERETAEWIIKRYSYLNTENAAILVKGGKTYRYDKKENSVTRVPEHRSETGWFSSYRECLQAAKDILCRQEPVQMHL